MTVGRIFDLGQQNGPQTTVDRGTERVNAKFHLDVGLRFLSGLSCIYKTDFLTARKAEHE